MIKHLFNHCARSIIRPETQVNALSGLSAKRAKSISKRAKGGNGVDDLKLPHSHGTEPAALRARLGDIERFQRVAEVFRQLGDPTRIRVFWLLCHCEECVVNLSALMGMSSPAVSHHLKALKSGGLICSRRVGKEVYYRAADTGESRLLHQMTEQVMEIACPRQAALEPPPPARLVPLNQVEEYRAEQVELVRQIHDQLLAQLDRKTTIDELSRQYHMNPTTLKNTFKEVYGVSIAAHIKAHRMERAAQLLRETGWSVAEVARAVGYDSQSRFTAAFKSVFHQLPREYRKG